MEPRSMYLYAWDALDAGIPALLDGLRGAGITGVKLASVYHGGKALLAGNRTRRVIYPEEGALYFRPDASFRSDSPLQPPVSRFCDAVDALGLLCEQAQRRHMYVDAWAVCLHNLAIARSRPDVCTLNAFGDRYLHSLCPMHPDVRAYLSALASGLGRYPIRRLVLEAFGFVPFRHFSFCEIEGVALGPSEQLLFSLCFCEACLSAFPPCGDLRAPVRAALQEFFRTGRPRPAAEGLPDLPGLQGLLEARAAAVAKLAAMVGDIAARHGKTLSLVGSTPLNNPFNGVDARRVGPVLAAMDFAYYQPGTAGLAGQLAELRQALPSSCDIDLLLRPGHPDTVSAGDLRSKVLAARAAGVRSFSFYNYGLLPAASREWLAALPPG